MKEDIGRIESLKLRQTEAIIVIMCSILVGPFATLVVGVLGDTSDHKVLRSAVKVFCA